MVLIALGCPRLPVERGQAKSAHQIQPFTPDELPGMGMCPPVHIKPRRENTQQAQRIRPGRFKCVGGQPAYPAHDPYGQYGLPDLAFHRVRALLGDMPVFDSLQLHQGQVVWVVSGRV